MTQNGTDDVSHEIAVAALASGSTIKAAAEKASISRETLHRWMRDADFKARVAAAAQVWCDVVQDRIKGLAGDAVDVLAEVMCDADAENRDRINAAKLILDRVAPATQKHEVKTDGLSEQEIEARLAQLGFERKEGA